MCFKGAFCIPIKMLLLTLCCQGVSVHAQDNGNDDNNKNITGAEVTAAINESQIVNKTNLHDKYYRQALYHYFQDDHGQALSQVEQSKAKLQQLDSRTSLFEAGLQLSQGLLQQAKKTLINFDKLLIAEQHHEVRDNKSTKANELLLISLLSLTDQYLAQGAINQAKDTLARVKLVSSTYYPQYHVLSQLAYWPNDATLLPVEPTKKEELASPYILLNDALRLIKQAKYEQALNLLSLIKSSSWQEKSPDFWKTLFLNEVSFASQGDEQKMQVSQGQAIQDYAQLLLAQIYISQQRYQLAFNELESFPQQSPYTESALFLFAFASQEVGQYDIAFNLLSLLYQDYPYSSLGWQSAELMAEQVSNQRSLAQGVSVYQKVESFFLLRQQDLTNFSEAFAEKGDLLDFFPLQTLPTKGSTAAKGFQTESAWLQQALYDAELTSLYQGLSSIDEQIVQVQQLLNKTIWLAEIIALNQQRKEHVVSTKQARNYPIWFDKLTAERDRLALILRQQEQNNDHTVFVNKKEKQWLERIGNSNSILKTIKNQRNTEEYQQRLARVQGVLSWQLAQKNPQRMWSHKKQLHYIDNALAGVTHQQQILNKLSEKDDSFSVQINKHQQSIKQLNHQLNQANKLREKFTQKIRVKVGDYIDEQDTLLAGHLLSTRQGMANVLERMAKADKKLSRQLMPVSNLKVNVIPTDGDNLNDMAGSY